VHRAVVLGAVLSGCSLLVGVDGLSDGEPSMTPDGGPPADGGGNGTVSEGGNGGDGDGESPDGGASPCQSPTTPPPFLCLDFDDGAPLSRDFPTTDVSPAASARIDQVDAVSPPGSLLITMPAGNALGASFMKPMPAEATEITIDVDVRLHERGVGADNDFLSFFLDSDNEVALEVRASGGEVSLDADTGGAAAKTPLSLRLEDRWTHLNWVVTIDGDFAVSTITADGVQVGSATTGSAPFRSNFVLGDRGISENTGTWRIRFDNLVVRVR